MALTENPFRRDRPGDFGRSAAPKPLDYAAAGDGRPVSRGDSRPSSRRCERTGGGDSPTKSPGRLASSGLSSLLTSRAKELDNKRPDKAAINVVATGQATALQASSPNATVAVAGSQPTASRQEASLDPLLSLLDDWAADEFGGPKEDPRAEQHPRPPGDPMPAPPTNQASTNITTESPGGFASNGPTSSLLSKHLQERALEAKKKLMNLEELSMDEVIDDGKSTTFSDVRSDDQDGMKSPFSDRGSVRSSTSKETPRMSKVMSGESVCSNAANKNKPRFDLLTLREWFIEMDSNKNGHVTKCQWLDFMRRHPQLIRLMVHGDDEFSVSEKVKDRFSDVAVQHLREEARQLKRLRCKWTDIDQDGNGTLEFEEFVEFFRQGGYLLEYNNGDNPRVRLAGMLGEVHEKETPTPKEEEDGWQQEFRSLGSLHLHGATRKRLTRNTFFSRRK